MGPELLHFVIGKGEEECLKNARAAFNRHDYAAAIRHADQSINDLGKIADGIEESLKDAAKPPTGKVTPAQKKKFLGEVF